MTFSHKARFALLFATSVSLAATAAVADNDRGAHRGGPDMRAAIEMLDLNGDGEITQAEMASAQEARFAAADTDGDGVLSEAELEIRIVADAEARSARFAARIMARLDENGDGVLSEAEAQMPHMDRIFSRLDDNDDGILSAEELARLDEPRRGWFGWRG